MAGFFVGLYVAGSLFYGFTAVFDPIREEFGWSSFQIAFASSLRGVEMGLFAPLVGFLVDRFGSRKLILFGTITVGIGFVSLSQTRSLLAFYASFLLLGLGGGGCTVVVLTSAVANWFKRNVGKAIGLMSSGFGAGGLILPYIVWLIDTYHWRTALIILGFGMWILGIPLSFVFRHKPEQYGYLPNGDFAVESPHGLEAQAQGESASLKEAFKTRAFWHINIVEALRMMTMTAVIIHIMPYLSSMGISRTRSGFIAAAIPLCSIIGRFGFGWFADIFDKKMVFAGALGLVSLGMIALCNIQEQWSVFLFILLFSLGLGGSMTLRAVILREYFGLGSFGKMLGITMGAAAFGGIIGPPLAGFVYDSLGSYHLIWMAFCGAVSLGIILILTIKPITVEQS